MNNVCLRESNRQVTIGMSELVELQLDECTIELERAVRAQHLAGNRACWGRQEIVVPVFNSLNFGKVLASILVSDNLRAD